MGVWWPARVPSVVFHITVPPGHRESGVFHTTRYLRDIVKTMCVIPTTGSFFGSLGTLLGSVVQKLFALTRAAFGWSLVLRLESVRYGGSDGDDATARLRVFCGTERRIDDLRCANLCRRTCCSAWTATRPHGFRLRQSNGARIPYLRLRRHPRVHRAGGAHISGETICLQRVRSFIFEPEERDAKESDDALRPSSLTIFCKRLAAAAAGFSGFEA